MREHATEGTSLRQCHEARAAARERAESSHECTQKERNAQRARAVARCKADRGVDCDTPQGLNEWVLQERSRAQAMREGSRRGSPVPEPVQPKK